MLPIKDEFRENRPKRQSHFTERSKMNFCPYFPQFTNDFVEIQHRILHVITRSDYELHVIRRSDSYILLSNLSEIPPLFFHL